MKTLKGKKENEYVMVPGPLLFTGSFDISLVFNVNLFFHF